MNGLNMNIRYLKLDMQYTIYIFTVIISVYCLYSLIPEPIPLEERPCRYWAQTNYNNIQ
jgi:hypothetical protein